MGQRNTVVVIEHNFDISKTTGHLLDLRSRSVPRLRGDIRGGVLRPSLRGNGKRGVGHQFW